MKVMETIQLNPLNPLLPSLQGQRDIVFFHHFQGRIELLTYASLADYFICLLNYFSIDMGFQFGRQMTMTWPEFPRTMTITLEFNPLGTNYSKRRSSSSYGNHNPHSSSIRTFLTNFVFQSRV